MERKRRQMILSDKAFPFEKASIHQLMVIVRFEECPPDYKNAALQLLITKGAGNVGTDREKAFD